MLGEGALGAAQAQVARQVARAASADDADAAVPAREQVLDHVARGRLVVDGHAREVGEPEVGGGARDQDARHLDLVERLAEVARLAAEEDHRLGAPRVLVVDCGAHLARVVVEVGDDEVLPGLGERRLEGAKDVVEEAVADAHHEGGDGGLRAHLEVAGVRVGLVAALAHDLEDALPGAVAHVWLAVDDARDGAHAVPRCRCDVPDVHVALSRSRWSGADWKRFQTCLSAV